MRFGVSQSTVTGVVPPPTGTPELKFNVTTNSQYVPVVGL